jgi:DNA-binding response OmpR family regulator
MKILFLEDDPIIADIVLEHLKEKAYDVDYAFDIDEAISLLDHHKYDLFLLDVNVPDGNAFEFLEDIRQSGNTTPAIFITALNTIQDMKSGFQSGCDDYIKKPFELDELDLRIENIKRLYKIDQNIQIDHNIYLDKLQSSICIDSKWQTIREKELLVLEYLSKNCTRAISSEELCKNIWTYDSYPSDATIRTYIKNLRNKIGNEKIQTIKGVGYRFIKS